jgi:hypothetical protein
MATARLLVIFGLGTLVVAGAFAVLAVLASIGGWWILPSRSPSTSSAQSP